MSLFEELKRRNVFRVAVAYVVAAWVLLQVVDLVLENIGAPSWVMQSFMLLLAIGFPLTVILAWAFEMTPEGVKREFEVDRTQSITPKTGRKLDFFIIGMLVVALGVVLAERLTLDSRRGSEEPVAAAPMEVVDAEQDTTKSVAVLPFVNMSSDQEQDYFSDGITEELLHRLAKNPELRVAARTSSFAFKGENTDVGEIGAALNVDHILEGSVRKANTRLRITAQLIEVDTGFHLWSETYERELDDVFAIQDEISAAITRALEVQLTGVTAADLPPTDNLDAYNAYLRGRSYLADRGSNNLDPALENFRLATTLDPQFADAWASLAFAAALAPSYGSSMRFQEAVRVANEAADRALRLDPDNAEALAGRGHANSQMGFDWESSRADFERAYALAPGNADVVNLYGDFLTVIGDFDNAIRVEEEAMNLDPVSSVHPGDLAYLNLLLNRLDEGFAYAERAVSLAPTNIHRIDALVLALINQGKLDASRDLIDSTISMHAQDTGLIFSWECELADRSGDDEALRECLVAYKALLEPGVENPGFQSPALIAFYELRLNGVEAALPWLQRAYDERDRTLTWPGIFYLPERFSSDPAWLEFWKKPELAALSQIRKSWGVWKDVGAWKPGPYE